MQEPEALYDRLCAIVAAFNGLISTVRCEGMSDSVARPDKGSVVFTSGLHGWCVEALQTPNRVMDS